MFLSALSETCQTHVSKSPNIWRISTYASRGCGDLFPHVHDWRAQRMPSREYTYIKVDCILRTPERAAGLLMLRHVVEQSMIPA